MNKVFKVTACLASIGLLLWCTNVVGQVQKDSIVLGTIGDSFVEEFKEFKPLADYIAVHLAELGINHGEVMVVPSISKMIELVTQGKVDIYMDSPFPVSIVSKATGAKPLLRRWKNGVSEYHSVIFVKKDSGLKNVHELKGKILAFEDPFSTAGYYLPKAILLAEGLNLAEKKERGTDVPSNTIGYIFSKDDYNTMLWVIMGKAQAGATNNVYYHSLPVNLKEKLLIIKHTPNIHRHIVCYRGDLDPIIVDKIKKVLLQAHQTQQGRKVLKEFKQTTRFDDFPEGSTHCLDAVNNLLPFVEKDISKEIVRSTQKDTLVIGRVSDNPKKHYQQLKPIVDYVVAHLKDVGITQGEVLMANDNQQMIQWLKDAKIDWVTEGIFSSIIFSEETGAEIMLRRWKKGAPTYYTIFFTKKDSDIGTLRDLKGKKIAFEDPGSTSAYFLPVAVLKREGLRLQELSSPRERPLAEKVGYAFAGGELNISTWVYKGLVDAGVQNNLDWQDPQITPEIFKKDFKIIYRSKPLPRMVELIRKDLNPKIKERIKQILLKAHNDPEAKEALKTYSKTEKFDEFEGETKEGLQQARRILEYIREELR
ncbi:MAG: phosphate/phosphite/phosphonate ABC transporter substrate-binding protein [Sedimentisphaerales bacterium]